MVRARDEAFSEVLSFVLAGGVGARLLPLTASSPKPLLPFGATHRLLDFTLSNVRHSGMRRAYVLSQHMNDAIGRYLRDRWTEAGSGGGTVFLNQPPTSGKRYRGTADAVAQNLREASGGSGSELVLVLSADHVYRMDYRGLLSHHVRSGAGVTVSAVPVSLDLARSFGVISADASGRILGFLEKPEHPSALAGVAGHALVNMGVYVFSRWILSRAIAELREGEPAIDFGRHVLPWMVERDVAGVYREPAGRDGVYWRDVGALDTYHASHMELLDDKVGFDIDDPDWPVRSGEAVLTCRSRRTRVAASALVGDAWVERSVVGPGVVVENGADVRESVLLPGARIGSGAALRGAVVAGMGRVAARDVIGFDRDADRQRFPVTGAGVVVIPAFGGVSAAVSGSGVSSGRAPGQAGTGRASRDVRLSLSKEV